MFEMATGSLPFLADTPTAIANKRMEQGNSLTPMTLSAKGSSQLSRTIELFCAYNERLYVTISATRVLAAPGNTAAGTKWLESALGDASGLGYVGYQLEARLRLGEIEMKSGDSAEGRAQLASLARDAQENGFGLVARRAAALLRRED